MVGGAVLLPGVVGSTSEGCRFAGTGVATNKKD